MQKMDHVTSKLCYLNNIVSNLPISIYWKDKSGVYLGCNESFQKMVGLASQEEIEGKTDKDLVWRKQAKLIGENDNLVIQSGETHTFEEVLKLADGKQAVMLVHKKPLRDQNDKIEGVLGILVDITDRKKNEILEEEKKLAEGKIKILNILSGGIAHETRTPLAAININFDILTGVFPELVKTREYKNIKSAIFSGKYFIDMLLMNIKETMTSSKDFVLCSMHETIKMALDEYPFFANERKLVHWRTNDDFCYLGNIILTKHILFNLLKNAIGFINGVGKGEIFITINKTKKHNQLIFKDTAVGISEHLLPKIFDQFVTSLSNGTGLGLAFCKKVMESYNGSVKCNSKEGKYTEFILSFKRV